MKKNIFALFATAALCAMATGCSDDDGGKIGDTSIFQEAHSRFCQDITACMQQRDTDRANFEYFDKNYKEKDILITNYEGCMTDANKMIEDMADQETYNRCKEEYSAAVLCLSGNMCNSTVSAATACRDISDAMFACFEKRTSKPTIEDKWGYRDFCKATANCLKVNGVQFASFYYIESKALATVVYRTADRCETEFERIVSENAKEVGACGTQIKDFFSCVTAQKALSCEVGSGNSECNDAAQAVYHCMSDVK